MVAVVVGVGIGKKVVEATVGTGKMTVGVGEGEEEEIEGVNSGARNCLLVRESEENNDSDFDNGCNHNSEVGKIADSARDLGSIHRDTVALSEAPCPAAQEAETNTQSSSSPAH